MKNNIYGTKYQSIAQLFVNLSTFHAFLIFVIFSVLFMAFRNFTLGVALLCTGLGFLLINAPFSDNVKSALGLALAFVGYMVCLPGTFKPVEQVVINPYPVGFWGKEMVVTVNPGACQYEMKTSKLTCDAQVRELTK